MPAGADSHNNYNDNAKARPAHETKHLPLLVYPFRDNLAFHLTQSNDGVNNGTALWLGAQVLSAFLTDAVVPKLRAPRLRVQSPDDAHAHALTGESFESSSSSASINPISSPARARRSPPRHRPCAIELGSGVGLTALVLAAQGWSVLATDTPAVVQSVLRPNVLRNNSNSSNTRNTSLTTTDRDTGTDATTRLLGTVQARTLDWTVPPEHWVWDDPESVTNPDASASNKPEDTELLGPPFDLIITSDTVYSRELVGPLLRTLKHLILLSSVPNPNPNPTPSHSESEPSPDPTTTHQTPNQTQRKKRLKELSSSHTHPPVYLALERRDPSLVDSFFSQARDVYGLNTQRIPAPRVRRAMSRGGLGDWKREDWEGVEVWRMSLRDLR